MKVKTELKSQAPRTTREWSRKFKTIWHSFTIFTFFHFVGRENYDWGSLRTAGEVRLEIGRDGAEGVYEVMFDAAELDA